MRKIISDFDPVTKSPPEWILYISLVLLALPFGILGLIWNIFGRKQTPVHSVATIQGPTPVSQ